jgi:hypothetical protein
MHVLRILNITARRIIATMQAKWFRPVTVHQGIRNTMRLMQPTSLHPEFSSPEPEPTVAARATPDQPRPALVVTPAINFRPEPVFQ